MSTEVMNGLRIRAFRGVRYDEARVTTLRDVTAPPYDVIDADLAAELRARHPQNIVHLDWTGTGSATRGGSGEPDYGHAGRKLHEWLADGVLVRDELPTIYVHRHSYRTPDDQQHHRWGFLVTASLRDADNTVHPHESTHGGPVDDRLELLRAARANLSPIFAAFEDPEHGALGALRRAVEALTPSTWTDAWGLEHAYWRVDDPAVIDEVAATLRSRSIVIADGHHRFESAQRFFAEQAASGASLGSADSTLVYLSDLTDPGLAVLPIHRLLTLAPHESAALAGALDAHFEPVGTGDAETVTRRVDAGAIDGRPTIGWLANGSAQIWSARDSAVALGEGSASLATYGFVAEELIHRTLAWDSDAAVLEERLMYESDWRLAADAVGEGRFDVGLMMPSVPVATIAETARAGGRMPAKTTHFYPKVPTGLVFHMFDDVISA